MLHSVFVSVCLCRRQWRGGGGGGNFVFALSQFWCFMVFCWLWSKNNGGASLGSATGRELTNTNSLTLVHGTVLLLKDKSRQLQLSLSV